MNCNMNCSILAVWADQGSKEKNKFEFFFLPVCDVSSVQTPECGHDGHVMTPLAPPSSKVGEDLKLNVQSTKKSNRIIKTTLYDKCQWGCKIQANLTPTNQNKKTKVENANRTFQVTYNLVSY